MTGGKHHVAISDVRLAGAPQQEVAAARLHFRHRCVDLDLTAAHDKGAHEGMQQIQGVNVPVFRPKRCPYHFGANVWHQLAYGFGVQVLERIITIERGA